MDTPIKISGKREKSFRRNSPRYATDKIFLRLKPKEENIFHNAEIVNVNKYGLCGICEEEIPTHNNVVLKIDIPDSKQLQTFQCGGRVVWSKRLESKAYYYGIVILDQEIWQTWVKNYDAYRIKNGRRLLDTIEPSALSIDVTNMCNLRCKHCFWDSYKDQLPPFNPNILTSLKQILTQAPSITNITWYGGEPLLNDETRKIVKEGTKLLKNNLVITNALNPIPVMEGNVHFAVSLDGTQKVNDSLRGHGTYKNAKQHVLEALAKNIPVGLIYCLNKTNIQCVENFVEEWKDTNIDGIVFTAIVPIQNKTYPLCLDSSDRDQAVMILLELKKKYPALIYNTEVMIELLRSEHGKEMAKNCLMNVSNNNARVNSIHLCNDGSIRKPCALGCDANCEECRSITHVALYAGRILRDKKSVLALFGMYHTKTHRSNAEGNS